MLTRRGVLAGTAALALAPPAWGQSFGGDLTGDIAILRRAYETLHPGLYRYATPRQRALWRTQLDEVRMERDPQVGCAMSQRAHRTRLAMLRALVAAHAPLLIGTDAPQPFVYPGFSLQKELDFHLEAGLTRAQILRMASRDAARFLHRR